MTISTDRIMTLVNYYRDNSQDFVSTSQIVQDLLALITEEENQMDSYYAAQAKALGYASQT